MRRLALIAAAALAASCGGSTTSPSVVTPTAPAATTETFTGTVQPPVNNQGQFDSHNFTVTAAGTLTVTLTTAGPPPTIKIGVGVGSPNTTGSCVLLSTTSWAEVAASTTVPALQGTLSSSGTYCVIVFDTGNVLQAVTYGVTVVHT
jgi:hypothetical protein